jgi:hypothetical protein
VDAPHHAAVKAQHFTLAIFTLAMRWLAWVGWVERSETHPAYWLAMTIGGVAHARHAQIARRANVPHGDGHCHVGQIRTMIRASRTR